MGGKFKKVGTCVCLWLIHVVVWQKPHNIVKQSFSNFFFLRREALTGSGGRQPRSQDQLGRVVGRC